MCRLGACPGGDARGLVITACATSHDVLLAGPCDLYGKALVFDLVTVSAVLRARAGV